MRFDPRGKERGILVYTAGRRHCRDMVRQFRFLSQKFPLGAHGLPGTYGSTIVSATALCGVSDGLRCNTADIVLCAGKVNVVVRWCGTVIKLVLFFCWLALYR